MAVTAKEVNELRKRTGAGVLDCKKALEATGGDLSQAEIYLRKQGMARAEARLSRAAAEGVVASYIHAGGRIGVLLELNCETDFVARTEEFQKLARELAMQVAAEDPKYLNREQVPEGLLEREKEIYREQAQKEGKPEQAITKITEGRLEKFYSQSCLLDQPYIRDDGKTVGQLVKEYAAKLGENVQVRRFARFQLGEDQQGS